MPTINLSQEYLYRISKILLFGSYLDENKNNYNDIDLAVELTRKIEDQDEFLLLSNEQVGKAKDEGKYFKSYLDELFYCENLVWRKLKSKDRYISLHRMSDGILEITKTKEIFL